MTQEQRERMEFYAGRGTQLAIAVRAALAEIDELRKDRERLEKLVNRSSRLTLVHWEDGTVTIFDDMTGNKMSVGNDLREAIDTIPEAAGLERMGFHVFRHRAFVGDHHADLHPWERGTGKRSSGPD